MSTIKTEGPSPGSSIPKRPEPDRLVSERDRLRESRIDGALWIGAIACCIVLWILAIFAIIEVAEQGL